MAAKAQVYHFADYKSGENKKPCCRGSFEEAAGCVAWINDAFARAKLPYGFSIVSADDHFRIGLYEREGKEKLPLVMNCENYRDPATLTEAQANHIVKMFTDMSFIPNELAFWESDAFRDSATCREIFRKAMSEYNVQIQVQGLTADLLKTHAVAIEQQLRAMPKPAL